MSGSHRCGARPHPSKPRPRLFALRLLAGLCAALATSPAPAETLRFHGYAFDLEDGRHLYTEVHEQQVEDGRWLGGRVEFHLPDGRLLGTKALDFAQDPYIPVYRLELPLEGYMEAITRVGETLTLERRQGREAPVERRQLDREGPTCADSGLHAFLVAHFAPLMAGETIAFKMVVAGSLEPFKFRAQRVGDTVFENRPAVRFRIEADSLLRFVLDPLELSYDPAMRMLLEYRGISSIRDPQTGKPYLTRVAYYTRPPAGIAKPPPLPGEKAGSR